MHQRNNHPINGLTLIEMMLALTLSVLILSGIMEIYLATENNHLTLTALSSLQENGNIAIQLLSSDIRIAGYIGCAKLTPHFPLTTHVATSMTPENKIENYQSVAIKEESDAITLRHASSENATLLQPMQSKSILSITQKPKFHQNDNLIISDCKTAEIFSIKKIVASKDKRQIFTRQPLNTYFNAFAEVNLLKITTYFIGKTERHDATGAPIYALYKMDENFNKTELVEGIKNMKIDYDMVEQGKMIEHPANEVRNAAKIAGISIKLTLTSLNQIRLQKNVYTYVALREI